MHACLYVNEILRLIACELVTSGGEATAVAFACCCKSFEDPVLDALWEVQCELTQLLETLPKDVWNEGKCTVSAQITYDVSFLNYFIRKYFRRLPTTLELARFRKYAQRIREFTDSGTLNEVSSEVFLVLQRFGFHEPLLPNLKSLDLWHAKETSIPFIPLFLSPATTYVDIRFEKPHLPKGLVASIIAIFSARCPNLQHIGLCDLPRDPMITAAASELLLTTNRNTLRTFDVDSPLTEEAREVVQRLSDLRELTVVIERGTSLPSLVLPSLTNLIARYDHDDDCLEMFRGATLGKLESIEFFSGSERIGNFLEAFERVALAASAQDTLFEFSLNTSCSWSPTFSSLLSFTQMKYLTIDFSCKRGCSSMVDDDIITNLARAMPKLECLLLGDAPCRRIPTGVTAKGLVVLAHHCPNLSDLCVHIQVAGLIAPPATIGMTPEAKPGALRRDCALKRLYVGKIPMPERSVLVVALTLARIFPRIATINSADEGWKKVEDAICLSRRVVDYSGKQHPPHFILK